MKICNQRTHIHMSDYQATVNEYIFPNSMTTTFFTIRLLQSPWLHVWAHMIIIMCNARIFPLKLECLIWGTQVAYLRSKNLNLPKMLCEICQTHLYCLNFYSVEHPKTAAWPWQTWMINLFKNISSWMWNIVLLMKTNL